MNFNDETKIKNARIKRTSHNKNLYLELSKPVKVHERSFRRKFFHVGELSQRLTFLSHHRKFSN